MVSLLSIVPGNSHTKVFNSKMMLAFPSVIASPNSSLQYSTAENEGDTIISYSHNGKDQGEWAIGNTAYDRADAVVNDFTLGKFESEFYRTLFAAGLVLSGTPSGEVKVAITLPVTFYSKKQDAANYLAGTYKVKYKGKMYVYEIADVAVYPEGYGVYIQSYINMEGNVIRAASKEQKTTVVEIGGVTCDISTWVAGRLLQGLQTTGSNTGVANLWRLIAEAINRDHVVNIPLHKLDGYIRSGKFTVAGKPQSMKPYLDKYVPAVFSAIKGHINNATGNGRETDEIIVGGGGAYVFKNLLLENYSNITIAEDPQFADARGIYIKLLKG